MTYLLVRGIDQANYGTFKKLLNSQFLLDNYQYPNTILAVVDALNNHKFDMKHYERQKRNRDHSRPEQN